MIKGSRTWRRLRKVARRMILRSGFTGRIEWCDDPIHPNHIHVYAWQSQKHGHFAELTLSRRTARLETAVDSYCDVTCQRIRKREVSHALALWLVDVEQAMGLEPFSLFSKTVIPRQPADGGGCLRDSIP